MIKTAVDSRNIPVVAVLVREPILSYGGYEPLPFPRPSLPQRGLQPPSVRAERAPYRAILKLVLSSLVHGNDGIPVSLEQTSL